MDLASEGGILAYCDPVETVSYDVSRTSVGPFSISGFKNTFKNIFVNVCALPSLCACVQLSKRDRIRHPKPQNWNDRGLEAT